MISLFNDTITLALVILQKTTTDFYFKIKTEGEKTKIKRTFYVNCVIKQKIFDID